MPDESLFTGWPLFLAGIFVLGSLFTSWYRKRDLLVGCVITYSNIPVAKRLTFIWQLEAIPTVGFSDPILSYFSALRFFFHGPRMLKEGYESVICSRILFLICI